MRLATCHPRNPTFRFRWTLLARPILPPLIGSVHGRLEFEDTGGPHDDEEPAAAGTAGLLSRQYSTWRVRIVFSVDTSGCP
jgi:hypothetical protein